MSNPPALRPAALAYLLCLASFASYLWLIRSYPVLYWYDSYMRLALHDRILVGHWLPMIQIVIFVAAKITNDLNVIRSTLALLAIGALAGAYRLATRLFEPMSGWIAATWLATNLMFVALALVPYAEVMFVGFVLLALSFLDAPESSRHYYLGVLMVNLACLTRYEGWLLAVVLIGDSAAGPLWARNWRTAAVRFMKATLLYGIAPLGWIIFGRPVGEPREMLSRLNAIFAFETGVFTQPLEVQILSRLNGRYLLDFAAQYFDLLKWQARLEIVLLGLAGLFGACMFSARRATHLRILAFLCLDFLLIGLFQPWEFGNLRQTFVVLVFLTLYAAFGLEQLIKSLVRWLAALAKSAVAPTWREWAMAVVALPLAAFSARSAADFVAGASHESDFQIPAQAGDWLRSHASKDAIVLALTDHASQPYSLAVYSQLPLDRLLDDDRYDRQAIQARLNTARTAYVIELEKSRAGLSPSELRILSDLESGRIPAQKFIVGPTRAWIVPAGVLIYSP